MTKEKLDFKWTEDDVRRTFLEAAKEKEGVAKGVRPNAITELLAKAKLGKK